MGAGRSSAQSPTDSWACQADRIFEGAATNDHVGEAVCTPARWNADTSADFLFGGTAQLETTTFDDTGSDIDRSFLFFGPAQSTPDSSPDLTFQGVDSHDRFGWSVAFLSDIDGDGRSEIAIGAPRGPKVSNVWMNRGRVYVYFSGDTTIPTSGIVSANDASLILEPQTVGGDGSVPRRRFGFSVASAGDIDGDGKGDLVVGAPGERFADGLSGRAYVYYGHVLKDAYDAGLQVLSAEAYARLIQEGDASESANDRLGYSVANAGDVDGVGANANFGWSVVAMANVDDSDSVPDFAVGAKLASRDKVCIQCPNGACGGSEQGGTAVGRVYIYRGGTGTLGGAPTLLARITGQGCRDRLGYSLAVAGNVGGDSRPDLLIGAVGYPFVGTPSELGRAYVVFTPVPAPCSASSGCTPMCP